MSPSAHRRRGRSGQANSIWDALEAEEAGAGTDWDETPARGSGGGRSGASRRLAPTSPASDGPAAPARRAAVVLLLILLLVGAAVADRASGRAAAANDSQAAARQSMPTAASASALASTWSCPLATSMGTSGAADGFVSIANAGRHPITGQITVIPADGEAANKAFTLDPLAAMVVRESDVLRLPADHPWAAALVDITGGQAAVELFVSGQWGVTSTPCSPSASDHWYFAAGATAVDANLELGLFNPFPSDAVVDLAFATDQGSSNPAEDQGLVVPARGLRVVNVGDHVRRRNAVATTVTARTGRIVAEQIQQRTAAGTAGLTAGLGAPSLGTKWYFPDGYAADHDLEHYVIYNPNPTEAHVSLAVNLDTGSAEPFDLTVPPASVLPVMLESESRIPPQVGHSAELTSLNGVAVTAERVVQASAPAPRVGLGDMLGGRVAAPRWLLAAGGPTPTIDEWIVVYNPGATNATVSLSALQNSQLVAVQEMQSVVIPPGGRHAFRLGDHIQGDILPVVVAGTAPVVVERDLYLNGQPGIALNAGLPLP